MPLLKYFMILFYSHNPEIKPGKKSAFDVDDPNTKDAMS